MFSPGERDDLDFSSEEEDDFEREYNYDIKSTNFGFKVPKEMASPLPKESPNFG